MITRGLISAEPQSNAEITSHVAPTRPTRFLGKAAPFVAAKKLTNFCSAAYQSIRALSPRKLKYHAIQSITPHQFNQKILQKAETLAQNIRQNLIYASPCVENEHLCIFEDGRISLTHKTIEEQTEKAIATLKKKYPLKKKIEFILRQAIAYHLDPLSMLFETQSKIKANIIQFKNLSLQEGNFDAEEKIALLSLLRQQYVNEHYIGNYHKKEIVNFILKELFPSENNIIKLRKHSFKLKLEREILLQSLMENILLHNNSPSFFKEKISEEIKSQIENNPDLKNAHLSLTKDALKEKISEVTQKFSICCPQTTHFFIERAVEFQMNKEQTLINFVKDFLSQAQKSFDYHCEEGIFKKDPGIFYLHIENILSDYPYLSNMSPNLVKHLKKWAASISDGGVYLDKNTFDLENSLIICAKSHDVYALKNSLSEKDIFELKSQFPEAKIRSIGKHIIGTGGFGKVRFAKNLATDSYVAVKKFTQINAAYDEMEGYQIAGTGENLVAMYNHAAVTTKRGQEKFYLFIQFVAGADGKQYFDKIKNNKNINAEKHPEDAKELKNIAQNYLSCALDLHRKGVFHRDIKPQNFLHTKEGTIKIIDYGFCTAIAGKRDGATIHYACPEFFKSLGKTHLYNAQKHDSFSLGVSLLKQSMAFKISMHAKIDEVAISRDKTGFYYLGFKNTEGLKGNNIDEVIMKLMDQDPIKRITPEEALNLPYFNEEDAPLLAILQNKTFSPLHEPTKPIFTKIRIEI